jgi:rhodanese-related sulfurtransferase
MQVALFLEKNGFSRVHNLVGGIDAWARTVDPAVPLY